MTKKNHSQIVWILVVAIIIVIIGYKLSAKHTRQAVVDQDVVTATAQAFPGTDALTFSDGRHVSFGYPSNWKLGKLADGSYNLQPIDLFVDEAIKENIMISVTSSCTDAGCATYKTLDTVLNEMKAIKLADAAAFGTPGYKIQFSDFTIGYMFIKGKSVVTVRTDDYLTYMNKIVSTMKLLAK